MWTFFVSNCDHIRLRRRTRYILYQQITRPARGKPGSCAAVETNIITAGGRGKNLMPPRTHLLRLTSIAASACASAVALSFTGCASERLEATPAGAVNLSGHWKYDPNLSDESDKQPSTDKDQSKPAGSGGRRRGNRGGSGAGGVPPYGASDGSRWHSDDRQYPSSSSGAESGRLINVGLPPAGSDPSTALPPGANGPAPQSGTSTEASRLGRLLPAPAYLLITQDGGRINIKSSMPDGTVTSEDFTAGQKVTVPFGEDTAERVMGWRGPVFIVTTKARKGGEMENDYALDEDGKLIVATELRAGHLKKPLDIKRVYDKMAN